MRRLTTQRLGLAVGAAVGVVATLTVVAVAVLVGGHDSKHPAYTPREGGVVSDPLEPPVIGHVFTPLPCPRNPQTTVALEGCAETAILNTDHKIDAQVKVIFGLLRSRRTRVSFVQGEEAWLRYRAPSCITESSGYDGGSAEPVAYGECVAARSRTHLRDLAALRATLGRH